jgi:hypothetical protein
MSQDFSTKWGIAKVELAPERNKPALDLACTAAVQVVCVLAILYCVRPTFVVSRPRRGAPEEFHWSAAIAISVIIATVTLCHSSV